MSIGSTIKRMRREHDMTQEQLAEHLGITSNAVSQWERDLTAPDISQLPILSNLFEITIDELLKNKYTYRLANGKEEYSNYMHMFTNNHDFLKAVMNMHQNWKGFDLVKNDERYRKILEAAELIAKK